MSSPCPHGKRMLDDDDVDDETGQCDSYTRIASDLLFKSILKGSQYIGPGD